jgi:hypothetical protein
MTRDHLRVLGDRYPRLGGRPRLLAGQGDIPDPIGGDQAVYDECGQEIWRHLEGLVAEVQPEEPCGASSGTES